MQVVAQRTTRQIVDVSPAAPGNRNDVRVWKETGMDDTWGGVNLIGDGGYRGGASVTSSVRGKGGRIIRDDTYTEFARKRATAEHVIARWKDWQVMRQNRKRGPNIDTAIRATAALYNMSPAAQTR